MAISLATTKIRSTSPLPAEGDSASKTFGGRWLAVALTGALALSGCISPPKSKKSKLELDVPNTWTTAQVSGGFRAQDWIKDFNDPQLAAIIEEALAHNHNLQAAEARLAASIAGSRVAGASLLPSLTGTANQNRNKRSSATGISQTPTSETFGINARFNWELDIWGKVRNGYKGDLADIQSAQADYAATRLSIAGRVAQAWYNALEAKQQFELSQRTLDALESSAVIVEENFKRGIARALDVRLVRANVATNRSTMETRLRQRDASVRTLETLLGRYPANELEVASNLTTRQSIEAYNENLDKEVAELENELNRFRDNLTERLEREQLEKIPAEMRQDVENAVKVLPDERTEVQKYLVQRFGDVARFDLRAAVNADPGYREFRMKALEQIEEKNALKKRIPNLGIDTQLPEISGPVPAGLPSEMLLRRPDVISAERSLAAAEQRKFEAGKARLPSLNLNLSRGTTTRDVEDIFEIMDRRVWNQSLNIAQTIFQGGRLRWGHRRAKANFEAALSSYRGTVLTAFREVETALNNQVSYERDYELQMIAAEESIAAEQLAWEEYGRGLSNITTALDAVRRSISAQRSLIQTANQRVQTRIDLYLALGGGFDFEPVAEH